jgi:hypothetical protein
MRIEVLFFDGCPSHERILPRVEQLAREAGAEVELRRIESLDEAERQRFLGSPTVRVDGEDIDPAAGERHDFGLKCRLYRTAAGASGTPPDEWLWGALERAKRS